MFPVRLLLLAISLIVSLVVLVNWVSGVFSYSSPEVSLGIEPLNSEARINILTAPLADENTEIDPDLRAVALRGAAWEPADARYISVLGLMGENEGKTQNAQKYYKAALEVLPVEIQALSRSFLWQLENDETDHAVDTAAIIYRRWPQYLSIVSSQLPNLLSSETGYQRTLKVFKGLVRGPAWIVDNMSRNPDAFPVVNRILIDWHNEGDVDLRAPINRFISILIQSRNDAAAYLLFLNTMSEDEKAESGYVFNSNFSHATSGSPFDWTLMNQSGLDMSIIDVGLAPNGEYERALQVRFFDSPVRLNKGLQLLRLPPSRFTLTVDYATRSLRGPTPIRLTIGCLRSDMELASVELAIGGSSDHMASTDFTVPPTGCEIQRIHLVNDNFVESWSNRYSGSLLLKSVSVTRTQ